MKTRWNGTQNIFMNELCSIIVPVYNAEKTLGQCKDSICQQTYRNLEIIFIDDGSTDGSGKLLDAYTADTRIKVIHKENEGVSKARNTGIKISTGKYIAFVDSDDAISRNYIETLVAASEEGYFAFSDCEERDAKGETLDYTDMQGYSRICDRQDVMKLSCLGILNPPYCKLFDGEIVRGQDIQFPYGWQIAEDLSFNLDYLNAVGEKKIKICEDTAYIHIWYPGSLDNRYVPDYWKLHTTLLTRQKEYAKQWKIPEADWDLYYKRYWQYARHALFNTMMEENTQSRAQKCQVNNAILKEKEVRESLKHSRKDIRKREYFFFRYLNYSAYDRMKKLTGK